MSHGGESGRWLVSYADFITLLMVLFVVLYSMGQTDLKKYKELGEAFQSAFSGGPLRVVDPQILQGGSLPSGAQVAPIAVEGLPLSSAMGAEVAGKLADMLAANNLSADISVQNNVEGVLISLSEKILYVPGTPNLQPDAYPILEKLVTMLKPVPNDIKIAAHTDNTPPTDPKYKNNWDLSTARALVIVDYFQKQGILPERMIAVGRGEYQPIFPNDTPEHRRLNGRAEITIVYSMEMDVINVPISKSNPSVAPATESSGESK